MSLSSKMTLPRVKIHNGIMKKDENVEIAVIVIDRFRLPPYIKVQRFEAPPPGETPVTKRPNRMADSEAGKTKPSPKEISGIKMNWQRKPIARTERKPIKEHL